jgi:hypothetical protein
MPPAKRLCRPGRNSAGGTCSTSPPSAAEPDTTSTGPSITLEGDANGAPHLDAGAYAGKFPGKYEHRVIKGGIGHNLPQEAPQAFAQAVIDVAGF